jgi:hypothetical protein
LAEGRVRAHHRRCGGRALAILAVLAGVVDLTYWLSWQRHHGAVNLVAFADVARPVNKEKCEEFEFMFLASVSVGFALPSTSSQSRKPQSTQQICLAKQEGKE